VSKAKSGRIVYIGRSQGISNNMYLREIEAAASILICVQQQLRRGVMIYIEFKFDYEKNFFL